MMKTTTADYLRLKAIALQSTPFPDGATALSAVAKRHLGTLGMVNGDPSFMDANEAEKGHARYSFWMIYTMDKGWAVKSVYDS